MPSNVLIVFICINLILTNYHDTFTDEKIKLQDD